MYLTETKKHPNTELHELGLSDDNNFSYVMHNDLDVIAQDIRDRHWKDTAAADTASPAADAEARLQDAMRFEGSPEGGYSEIILWVFRDNIRARAFYDAPL